MKYYPMPNLPGNVNNYYYSSPNPITLQNYDWKVDYNISSGNRLTASMNYADINEPYGGQFAPTCGEGVDCVNQIQHVQTDVISDVWSISPNVVNEFRASLMRPWASFVADDLGKNWGSTLGIANLTAPTFPGIAISGASAPGPIGELGSRSNTRYLATDGYRSGYADPDQGQAHPEVRRRVQQQPGQQRLGRFQCRRLQL